MIISFYEIGNKTQSGLEYTNDLISKTPQCLYIYETDDTNTHILNKYPNTFGISVRKSLRKNFSEKNIEKHKNYFKERLITLYKILNNYEAISFPFGGFEVKGSTILTKFLNTNIEKIINELKEINYKKELEEEMKTWNIT
jgi:hypothetical protein